MPIYIKEIIADLDDSEAAMSDEPMAEPSTETQRSTWEALAIAREREQRLRAD